MITSPKKPTNLTTLSKQQRNALDYWNGATNQLERTSRSILELFRRNNDSKNYSKYESQYGDFKIMRDVLTKDVANAIQSNNFKHIEEVIAGAVKKLKDKIYLHGTSSEKYKLKKSMSKEYDQALLALTKCMTQLRKKMEVIDKCLSRLSAEMTIYNALGKEIRSLIDATVQAKKDRRDHVARTVIALGPEIMSYIERQ